MFYGSVIARFFGVLVVFLLRTIYSIVTGKKIKSFSEVWRGPQYDDAVNYASYEMKHIVIGIIVIFVTFWLLMKITI